MKKKAKVSINAGAILTITDSNGKSREFNCTGTNEVTGKTPAAVLKNIRDCIDKSIKSAASSKSR